MTNVRYGLVGYGAWGKCHGRAIRETSGCELAAVCSATDGSRAAAEADGVKRICGDFRELVADPNVDVVDIVAPNHVHEEIACAALAAGKHVLLEKPMSVSIESCDRIIASAKKAGKLLLIGHEMRFSAMYAGMKELVDSGRLGEPRYVIVDLWRRPYRNGADGWRMDPKRVGNWTLEEPVHYFDAAAWYLSGNGEPATVFAYGNAANPSAAYAPNMSDNFTAVVTYSNRAYAVISQTLAAVEHHCSIKIFGSKGLVRAEWHAELDRSEHPSYSLEASENGAMRALEVKATPGELFELQEEIAAMARAVREGAPLPMTPEEGRRAVALCLDAQTSLETGMPVPFTRAGNFVAGAGHRPGRMPEV